jgi:hypothetical protein
MDQSDEPKEMLVTVSLDTLGFKSNELPITLPLISEIFNDTEISTSTVSGESIIILERYNVYYGTNLSEPSLILLITKYESKDSAINVYSEYNETLFDNNFSGIIYQRIIAEKLGDESAVGSSTSGIYQIVFRKLNVVIRFYANVSKNEAIDYTKVLVNHLEKSLN